MSIPQSAIYVIIAAGVAVFLAAGAAYLYPSYREIDIEAQQYQENIVLGARARADWEDRGGRLQRPRRAARREGGSGHIHSHSTSFELA